LCISLIVSACVMDSVPGAVDFASFGAALGAARQQVRRASLAHWRKT
jgi:hypothetical protein